MTLPRWGYENKIAQYFAIATAFCRDEGIDNCLFIGLLPGRNPNLSYDQSLALVVTQKGG